MKNQPMSETALLAAVNEEIQHSLGSRAHATTGSELARARAEAMDAYQGKPVRELVGQTIEGRSKITSADVQEVVDSFMPDAMQVLLNPQQAPVSFKPMSEEDEEAAEEETDAVNWVVCNANNAYETMYQYAFSAALQKNGFGKVWWDDTPSGKLIEYENVTDEDLMRIKEDKPEWQPVEFEEAAAPITDIVPGPDGQPIEVQRMQPYYPYFSFRDMKREGKISIKAIPPEHLGVNADTTSVNVDEQRFIFHYEEVMRSKLKLMYPDKAEQIDEAPHTQGRTSVQQEQRARNTRDEDRYRGTSQHASQRIPVYECYYYVDVDGDGLAEHRKVVKIGDGGAEAILENAEVVTNPFFSGTVAMRSFRFHGWSLADKAMPTYVQKSTIRRQMFDNAYLTNNARPVMRPEASMPDYMTHNPGAPIRLELEEVGAESMPAAAYISMLQVPPIIDQCLATINYLEQEREGRVGVGGDTTEATAAMLGGNIGDWSVERLMTERDKRKALYIRSLAETGCMTLYSKVRQLLARHQQEPLQYRKSKKWLSSSPADWAEKRQMEAKVGLGTGEANRERVSLGEVTAKQGELKERGSLLVNDELEYNALDDWQKRSGLSGRAYFLDPESPQYQQAAESQAMAAEQQQQQMEAQQQQMLALQQGQQQTLMMIEQMRQSAKIQSDQMKFFVDSYKAATDRADVEMTHDEQVTERGPANGQ